MKIFALFMAILLGFELMPPAFSKTYTIEEGTPVYIKTEQKIILQRAELGSVINLKTSKDITSEDGIVLVPAGANVEGFISNLQAKKPQSIEIILKKMVLSNGEEIPLTGIFKRESQVGFSLPRFGLCLLGGVYGLVLGIPFYAHAAKKADIKENTAFQAQTKKNQLIEVQ